MKIPVETNFLFVQEHLLREFDKMARTVSGFHPPEEGWIDIQEKLDTPDDWSILPGSYKVVRYIDGGRWGGLKFGDSGLVAELWSHDRGRKEIYRVEYRKPDQEVGHQVDWRGIKKGVPLN